MIKVTYEQKNFEKAKAMLNAVNDKSQKLILRKSVNDTARQTLNYIKGLIPKYVDRPKPITMRSLYARFANKDRIDATIEFKAAAGKKLYMQHWLAPMVFGVNRRPKGLDAALKAYGLLPDGYYAVPTKDIRTDGFGNVRGPYVSAMISYLRIDRSGTQNRSRKKKRINVKKKRWFVARPNNKQNIKPGIYEWRYTAFGKALRMVYSFERTSYRKIFPFFDLGLKYSAQQLFVNLKTRIDEAVLNGSGRNANP